MSTIQEKIQQKKFCSLREQSFVSLLYVASDVLQRVDALCGAHGLTHTQYNVLRILRGAHPEGRARCEIGERLIGRAPDVTRLIDRMEAQGWVKRSWSEDNRRLSIARITPEGLALLERLDPLVEELQEQALGDLSEAQLRQLVTICERIAQTRS